MKPRFATLIAGLVAAGMMSFATAGPSRAQDGEGVVAALSSDFATLDPTVHHAIISWAARLNIFDSLTDIGPDGSVIPRLATEWESSDDAKTWTFTIRTDATFHNGEPVTMDDVIWSFQKIIDDEKSPTRTYLANVDSIEKVSETQLRFHLKQPFAPFDRNMVILMVVPKMAYQEMGAEAFGRAPIGSGPYRLVEWVRDDHMTLEAFDGWWGEKPAVETITLRPVPNEASRAAALVSGEVDMVPALAPAMIDTLRGREGVKVEVTDGYKVVYLGFDPALPALSDVRMRQAIDLAIDRDAITKQLLRGMATPVNQILAPVSFGYDESRAPTPFDPEKARELVQASGYDGSPITLEYPNDAIASADQVAAAIQGYLQAVGVNVRLSSSDYNTFYASWSAKKLNAMHMFVFGPILLDADVPVHSIFATSGNRGYLFDPKVDELAAASRAEANSDKRLAIIADIWKTSDAYQPFVYLYNEKQAVGLRDGVTWKVQPDGIIRGWTLSKAAD